MSDQHASRQGSDPTRDTRRDDRPRPRFGIGVPNGGDFADPHRLAELAREAEGAGWDGIFLWDHVIRRPPWQPMVDPWVSLAAIAVATEQIILGPMVTPLPRRRTSVVARQTVTLDVLSRGRTRLGVGLGAPDDEFTRFGEGADPRHRAQLLDESLDLLGRLWSGEEVTFAGEHLTADGVQFLPRPVHGRIPIWVAGGWPGTAPFRRAARHDGVWPIAKAGGQLTIEEFGACVDRVRRYRRASSDGRHRQEHSDGARAFDACYPTRSPGPHDARTLDRVGRLTEAGMTWWIESLDVPDTPVEEHRARVLAGPPAP